MNNQLFLIIVIVVVLYIIQYMSNRYTSSKPTSIRLPELEYVLKNAISESRKEAFTSDMRFYITANMNLDQLKNIINSVTAFTVNGKLKKLSGDELKILKDKVNYFIESGSLTPNEVTTRILKF